MSAAKWTPGPWQVSGSLGAAGWITTVPGDGRLAQIAAVYGPSITLESAANARLIAAAPDLAAVVERLCAQFRQAGIAAVPDSNDPTEDMHAQALAALAKVSP